MEKLLKNIQSLFRILEAQRLKRELTVNNEPKLTPTQFIYFRCEGCIRPDSISFFQVRHTVDLWHAPIKILLPVL